MELVDSFEGRAGLKVFHISSDYARQRLYGEMISHLAAINIEQFVYVPVRSVDEIDCNRVSGLNEVQYLYSHILRKFHRIFFRLKVRTIAKDLLKYSNISHYSLMHAHFLYSDGAVARRIQKITGLPYIVAVRNTDVNVFMRLRPDLQWICWDILRHASRIVFMTHSYFQLMCQRAPADVRVMLKKKAVIIPNGLDHFWLGDACALERPERGCPLHFNSNSL